MVQFEIPQHLPGHMAYYLDFQAKRIGLKDL